MREEWKRTGLRRAGNVLREQNRLIQIRREKHRMGKRKQSQPPGCFRLNRLTFLLCLPLFAGVFAAEPAVTGSAVREENPSLLWYLQDAGGFGQTAAETAAVTVGEHAGEIAACGRLGELEEITYKTIILIDNSLSISEANRVKTGELVCALLDRHLEQEEFLVYTFDTGLHEIGRGTDYEMLKKQVEEITYQDQDAYLAECLEQALTQLTQLCGENAGQGFVYGRLLLIGDGKDENPQGTSYGDLRENLLDAPFRYPVHTAVSIWEKDRSGMNELATLSSASGGVSCILDEYEEPAEIAERINQNDADAGYIMIRIPPEEKDGLPKDVSVTVDTGTGPVTLSRTEAGFFRTPQEEQELFERAAPPETEEPTEQPEELPAEAATEALRAGTEEQPVTETELFVPVRKAPSDRKRRTDRIVQAVWHSLPRVLFLLAAAGAGAGIYYYLKRKRSNEEDAKDSPERLFYEPEGWKASEGEHPLYGPGGRAFPEPQAGAFADKWHTEGDDAGFKGEPGRDPADERTVGLWEDKDVYAPEDRTVAMWGAEDDGKQMYRIRLEELTASGKPGEHYQILLSDAVQISGSQENGVRKPDEAVLGRGRSCAVVLAPDRSVSKKHLRIFLRKGEVMAEDLSSTNGTFVNGKRITSAEPVHDGDLLGIGKKQMRVEVKALFSSERSG